MRNISQFTHGTYDVLIVGGGINGAAIAHMAALNGLKVALLEKGDFASGTSSKSTKLIHGGLRYLETFDLDLVREALRERSFLLRDAPHLVTPLSFIIPVYRGDRKPLWMMRLGVALYDRLAGKYRIGRHRFLRAREVMKFVPGLNADGLAGGVLYFDAQMDDARLVLENVLSAEARGAHVANYVEVKSFIKKDGKAAGVRALDALIGKEFDVYARRIVCAVGPWTNVLMRKEEGNVSSPVRTTKGIHVVCPGKISDHALLFPTAKDKRVFFIIPWMGNSLIGTTDTDYEASPDEVAADQEDIDYLFRELRRIFPGQGSFEKEKIVTAFAGLRPLVHKEGAPSQISRQHVIKESYSGVIYVMGGKYTTYRKIAEDCLRVILPSQKLVDTAAGFPVFGSGKIVESAADAARAYGFKEETVQYLMDIYGTRYRDVVLLARKDPTLKEPLCSCSPAIKAQVVYATQTEMAVKEEDIIRRRLSLVYRPCRSGQCVREIQRFVTQ
ncbi:MAG: glycerol-3-phosphate dehydrogenase/oxidase [Candidatus Omnitrophica bacterium]|nr:glycerol-3-phosphate dehydrogenase/oxidase [Candidatus Omnitrophota bacterium]